jgi:dTDP-4-dehydrorhamnose 3,5-epimerase
MRFHSEPLAIPEIIMVTPRRYADARGYFTETYRAADFEKLGVRATFIQDNQSMSVERGTVRGLHFQRPPWAQAKLTRVLKGAIFDVAVDLRQGSKSYGKWVGTTLSAEGGEQLFIPQGFAHGYCTLEPGTEIAYKCDAYYAAEYEGGIHFADPQIAIDWPVTTSEAVLSDRDRALPSLRDIGAPFIAS